METFGEVMKRLDAEEFTGRDFELQYFRKMLKWDESGLPSILNVYGTGGIGKTTLLARFHQIAEAGNAFPLTLNLRDCMGSQKLFLQGIAAQIGFHEAGDPDFLNGIEPITESFYRHAAGRKLVMVLDQYEEVGSMDQWLRESFFPLLRSDTLIVIAGKYPLSGPWRLSTLWRKLIVSLPLSELHYDEVRSYLHRNGITDELLMDRLWLSSAGHPLSLSLLTDQAKRGKLGSFDRRKTFEELMQYWFQEVVDEKLVSLVYAASVPRSFDQELLQAIFDDSLPAHDFERLTRLSFLSESERGWQLHDLVREAVRNSLQQRLPDTYLSYRNRMTNILRARIRSKLKAGNEAISDIYEMISHAGNPILRAHFRHNRSSENYWEKVTKDTLAEAERYIERRKSDSKSYRIACSDPESDAWFRYELTAEASTFRLSGWEAGELSKLDEDSLHLLRSPDGDVIGVSAMMAVGKDTLPYLLHSPVSAPYFRSFRDDMNAAAHAKFIFAIDVIEISNRDLRSDSVNFLMEHILSGSLLISSPPALPFYLDSHNSIGFEPVPDMKEAYIYHSKTPAMIFRLDTRGSKLMNFLEQAANYGSGKEKQNRTANTVPGMADSIISVLTLREREVAELLAKGATNKEIAASLYISEAAVKKHLNAMLQKTGLKNRTQFVAAMLDSRAETSHH